MSAGTGEHGPGESDASSAGSSSGSSPSAPAPTDLPRIPSGSPVGPRSLFGPVSPAFADEYLTAPRRAGACLCLGVDVPFPRDDTWAAVASRLPAGWRPDRVLLWLPG